MKRFGLSLLSPLPCQALIQPSESTGRQTVWVELQSYGLIVCFHLTLHMARLHSLLHFSGFFFLPLSKKFVKLLRKKKKKKRSLD